jgi:hypothetical protein
MQYFLIVGAAVAVLYGVYRATHWLLPTYGTHLTNAFALVAMGLDFMGQLPWGGLLDTQTTALMGVAIAASNNLMRGLGAKKAVGEV